MRSWLSRKTGETYRLPTDEEWAYRGRQPVQGRRHRRRRQRSLKTLDRPLRARGRSGAVRSGHATVFGAFGANENGLLDVAGNVWEWTDTCFVRRVLDDAGKVISESPNCGVRVVEGQHRAYVTDFIRDARAGGCAAGVPPGNLGFRLVVERDRWPSVQRLVSRVKALL